MRVQVRPVLAIALTEAILLLVISVAVGPAEAYLVHEIFEENYEEPSRGKRQEAGTAVAGASYPDEAGAVRTNYVAPRNLYYLEPNYYWEVRDRQKIYRQHLQKKKFERLQNYHKQMHELAKERLSSAGPNSLLRSSIGAARKSYSLPLPPPEPKKASLSKYYDVYELIDESSNAFSWPKWLGFSDLFSFDKLQPKTTAPTAAAEPTSPASQ